MDFIQFFCAAVGKLLEKNQMRFTLFGQIYFETVY